MDLTYTGATGTGIGVWSVFDTRESSSGGPFYRDIENQGDGAGSDQEVYNYMNSGHEEPEAWRLGGLLYGPLRDGVHHRRRRRPVAAGLFVDPRKPAA